MAKKQVSSSRRRARVVGSSSGRRAGVVGELEWSESSSRRRARVVGELESSESSSGRRARVVGELESSKSSSHRRAWVVEELEASPEISTTPASCIYIFSGVGSGLRIIPHLIICAQYTICGMLRNAIVVFSPGGVSLCRWRWPCDVVPWTVVMTGGTTISTRPKHDRVEISKML